MEPANRKSDLRIIKTKRAIHTAFAELLTEKDMDDITVTDIASRAIINRKTFYNNYRGVYELVDELENEVIRTFDTAMQRSTLSRTVRGVHEAHGDHQQRYGFLRRAAPVQPGTRVNT